MAEKRGCFAPLLSNIRFKFGKDWGARRLVQPTKARFVKRGGRPAPKDLRQAMIHYRTLFEELVGEPEAARP